MRWKPPIFMYFINNMIFVLALLLWCCISVSEKCLECCYSAPWGQWFGWSQDMHFSWELCTGKAFRCSHFQAGWIQQGKLWQHSLQHTQQLQYLARKHPVNNKAMHFEVLLPWAPGTLIHNHRKRGALRREQQTKLLPGFSPLPFPTTWACPGQTPA